MWRNRFKRHFKRKFGKRFRVRFSRRGKLRFKRKNRFSKMSRGTGMFKVSRKGSTLPMKKAVVCVYRNVQTMYANPALSGVSQLGSNFVIRANSIYDPNYASTPFPAAPYNESTSNYHLYSAMYNSYCVLGSKVTMTVEQINGYAETTVCPPLVFGLKVDDDASITGSVGSSYWHQQAADPNVVCKELRFTPDSKAKCTLTRKFSCKKWFGEKYPLSDPSLQTPVASNPIKPVYYVPFFDTLDANSGAPLTYPSVVIKFVCKYYVVFTEPKDVMALGSTLGLVQS